MGMFDDFFFFFPLILIWNKSVCVGHMCHWILKEITLSQLVEGFAVGGLMLFLLVFLRYLTWKNIQCATLQNLVQCTGRPGASSLQTQTRDPEGPHFTTTDNSC